MGWGQRPDTRGQSFGKPFGKLSKVDSPPAWLLPQIQAEAAMMHLQLEHGVPVQGMTFSDKMSLYMIGHTSEWWEVAPCLTARMKLRRADPAQVKGTWLPLPNPIALPHLGNTLLLNLIRGIPGGEENVALAGPGNHNGSGPRAPVDLK